MILTFHLSFQALNPGNLKSDLDRNCNFFEMLFRNATTYPTINGAYTTLFAGISDEVKENSGAWSKLVLENCFVHQPTNPLYVVVPWGRIEDIRKDLLEGSKPEEEGGTGIAQKFWKWSEEQTSRYA